MSHFADDIPGHTPGLNKGLVSNSVIFLKPILVLGAGSTD